MGTYNVIGAVTNTASSSLPSLTLIGSSSKRVKLHMFLISSEAPPNDQSVLYTLQRCTTAGTAGGSFTPTQNDPADGPALATCGTAVFSVGPTFTANAFMWRGGVHLRSAYQFQAQLSREIFIPATANNGLGALPLVVNGGAYTSDIFMSFDE